MRHFFKLIAATTFSICIPVLSAAAQETGFANMHTQAPLGNKICFTDHTHDGKGSGATEREARASAANAWQSFTDWEYGGAWASYANATGKRERCEPEFGQISCYVVAYPCKPRGGRFAAISPAKVALAARSQRVLAPKPPVTRKAATPKLRTTTNVNPKRKVNQAPALRGAILTTEQVVSTSASTR